MPLFNHLDKQIFVQQLRICTFANGFGLIEGGHCTTKHENMFKDFKEFQQFMIFCHTHYELNDVWHFENGDKGIFFDGWHNNENGNQKYSPAKLNELEQPTHKKRTKLEEVYEVWQKVRANLHYI